MTQTYSKIGTRITVVQDGRRMAIFGAQGLADKARQIAQIRGIEAARQAAYGTMMPYEFQIPTPDETLCNIGSSVVNGLILKAEGRDTTYGTSTGDIAIEFDCVKIDVTRENTIKEESIIKRSGTIKEYIQHKDYVVVVSGNLRTNSKLQFPTSELRQLADFLEQYKTFSVANVYIESFGISKLVLTKLEFKQEDMRYFNVLPFKLEMKSDTNYDFLVEEM